MSKYDKILEEIEKRKYFILGDDPGNGWSKYSTWFEDKEAVKIQKGAVFNENKHSLIFTTFNANIENKQRIGNKIYYTNIEEYEDSNPPWYDDIKNVQIVKFKIKIKPKTCSFWFYNGANIIKIENLYNLDTSDVTDMSFMFADCRNLTSLDLSSFDTSNVTTMLGMFIDCFKLSYLDISGFDTSNVNNMMGMFAACYSLKALDLSNFDTSKTLYIKSMFSKCESLTSLDLGNFDISKVTDLSYMFEDCQNLTSLDLSNFDTFNVTNIEKMFQDCSKLESINVSNLFDVSNVRIGEDIFLNCYSLVGGHGTVYNWEHTGVEYAVVDYYNESQKNGYFSNKWVTPEVAYAVYDSADKTLIFFEDKKGKYREEQIIDTKTYYTNIETRELPLWNTKEIHKVIFETIVKREVEDINFWFYDSFGTIEEIEGLEKLDTSNVTSMNSVFSNCSNLTFLDLSSFNITNVIDMSYMFNSCYNLTTIINIEQMPDNFDEMFFNAARDSGQITLRYFYPVVHEQAEELKATENEGNVVIEIGDSVAYAVYDSSDNSLIIFRDEKYKYENEQVIDTKIYYAGIEDITEKTRPKWFNNPDLHVTDVRIQDTFKPKTAYQLFGGGKFYLTNLFGLWNLDTSECTNMSYMFSGCFDIDRYLEDELDLSNFDTSKVTDMSYMFSDNMDSPIKKINISSFDTSNVTNMKAMFNSNSNLEELDLNNFDTSNVVNMSGMFAFCESLTELDLSNFNTSNVTVMDAMFRGCKLTSLDLSSFNTLNITNMSHMFDHCEHLTSLNLSNFNTSNVTDMENMFNRCYSLTTTLNIMNMPTKYDDMCKDAAEDSGQVTLRYFDPVTREQAELLANTKVDGNVIIEIGDSVAYAVYDSNDESLIIFRDEKYKYENEQVIGSKTYYTGIEDIEGETYPKWFNKINSVTKVIIKNIFKPKTGNGMFYSMENLTEIEGIENLDTSECINMHQMFYNCPNLTSLDLSNFNTSNVTTMREMFIGCENLTSLDLSSFNTSKVTNMVGMFYNCYNLTATLNIMNMPSSSSYLYMCYDAARDSGQLTLKYFYPAVTREQAEMLKATKRDGNVVIEGVEAYAVYDSNDKSLTIFRDEIDKYTDGQVIDTKTYYTGIEDIAEKTYPKWYSNTIFNINIVDVFKPKTGYHLFDTSGGYLESITGLKNLDTSNITDMSYMFVGQERLQNIDVSSFDTSNVVDMVGMFWQCSSLTELDLSNFDTSKVMYMGQMFCLSSNITATLNIMNRPTHPSYYYNMCYDTSKDSGQLTLKYTAPVTSADIDLLVATKNDGNVINGGEA